jgi:hypothetical protein
MEVKQIHILLKKAPFEPFRLYLSDGAHYDVRHPEQMLLSQRTAYIGVGPNGDGPFQRIALVSLVHVTRIDSLPDSAP